MRLTTSKTNFSNQKAAKKLNSIDWKKDASEWDRLFMSGGKIITKKQKFGDGYYLLSGR